MAVDPNCVVECFNVLKDQPVGLIIVSDPEAVQPFALDQGMKRLDAGVVIRIAFMTVAEPELLRCFAVSFGNILTSAI